MEMISDNAAARLLSILRMGKTLEPSVSTKNAWMRIFELKAKDPDTSSVLMSKLGQVMLLPHETRILVEQYYPDQVEALNHTLNQIQIAFTSQNLSSTWETFIRHIDNHCISTLTMTTALLDNKLENKIIKIEQLDDFKSRVQTLIDETINSSLSNDFKKFMTHYLQKILSAMNDYLISGAMPILDAVEATLGHAVLDPNFKQALRDTDTGHKIRDMLGDLANVVTVATAATGAVAYIASNGFNLLG